MKKWFSGVRARLLLVSVLALVSLVVVGLTGFLTISKLSLKLEQAYKERLVISEELGNLDAGMHACVRWLWTATAYDNDVKERKIFTEKSRKEIETIDKAIKVYLPIPKSEKSQNLIRKQFLPSWDASKKVMGEIISTLEKNDSHATTEGRALIISKLRPALAPATEADIELQEIADATNKRVMNETLKFSEQAKDGAIIIALLAGIACFVISIYMANQLVRVLLNLSYNLQNSSSEVSSAAAQIAASAEELSQSTVEQASSLEETSSSIYEISSIVNKTAGSAVQASKDSIGSQKNALKGKEVVENMITSINDISDSNKKIMLQIEQSNSEISEIVKVIAEIGNKTKVIDDIVFQTKLLSFNASVEAARAGEHGKGFAVVAEEVGKLAQMSGNASKEISDMLDRSIEKVQGIVRDTNLKVEQLITEGRSKVELGIEVAEECGAVLEEIVKSTLSVSEMANEIAISSEEQSRGVSEVTKSMNLINVSTQQNSSVAGQSATAAEELSVQANLMKDAVQTLMTTIEG